MASGISAQLHRIASNKWCVMFFAGFVLAGTAGCGNGEQIFPPEPRITFLRIDPSVVEEFTSFADTSVINIYLRFQDGDGDLGSDDASQFNFFIEDSRTDRLPLVDSTIIDTLPTGEMVYDYDTTYNGIIASAMPSLTPDARNPSIQGEIRFELRNLLVRLPKPWDPINPIPPTDTVRFQIYVVDRAGNRSNTITTDLITILPNN